MEWVETTGKTVEEAKDAALDQLGIHEDEAEFEVVEEPRPGLFGRVRGEARVRARVAPKAPRPKEERRGPRRRSERKPEGKSSGGSPAKSAGRSPGGGDGSPARKPRSRSGAGSGPSGGAGQDRGRSTATEEGTAAPRGRGGREMTDDIVSVEAQAEIVERFLEGFLASFDASGTITSSKLDEDTIELAVEGDDLGLLIGPKGQTLAALQDLSRTVLQRVATGRHEGRVRIDVSGYRRRRQEALARFTEQQAAQVVSTGRQRALEPMNAADRKVVHDTANEIEGVSTVSEGEDPRRRVIIIPAT